MNPLIQHIGTVANKLGELNWPKFNIQIASSDLMNWKDRHYLTVELNCEILQDRLDPTKLSGVAWSQKMMTLAHIHASYHPSIVETLEFDEPPEEQYTGSNWFHFVETLTPVQLAIENLIWSNFAHMIPGADFTVDEFANMIHETEDENGNTFIAISFYWSVPARS